jgi:hypothetical protein
MAASSSTKTAPRPPPEMIDAATFSGAQECLRILHAHQKLLPEQADIFGRFYAICAPVILKFVLANRVGYSLKDTFFNPTVYISDGMLRRQQGPRFFSTSSRGLSTLFGPTRPANKTMHFPVLHQPASLAFPFHGAPLFRFL